MNLLRLKHLFAGCFLAVSTLPAWGQAAPTLAIRIDDLGAFHSVNEACIQTYQSGIARSVEVMPVAAWYPEAVRLLKENPGLFMYIHNSSPSRVITTLVEKDMEKKREAGKQEKGCP